MREFTEHNRYRILFENVPLVIWEEDLSQLKKYLDKLKTRTDNLKEWFDNHPEDMIKAISLIEVIDVNNTALEFYGAESKEQLINNMDKLFSEKALHIFKDVLLAVANNKYYFAIESETKTFTGGMKATRMEIKIPDQYRDDFSRVYVITFDISKRKAAEETLQRQKAYFQQLFDKSPDAIVLMDTKERIIRVNNSFENLFGYGQQQIRGQNINDLIVPPDKKEESLKAVEKVKKGNTFTGETVRVNKQGQKIDVSVHGYPIMLGQDQLGIYAVYRDITSRKREEEKIRYLSYHDQLTGLYNRRYFENEMERLSKSRRYPISIIIADVDKLKMINDQYGHKEGDRHLKVAANIINSSTREADIVARIGGDEFAVILPETSKEEAEIIRERALTKCQDIANELTPGVKMSLGVATARTSREDMNDVFKEADDRMYKNKRKK